MGSSRRRARASVKHKLLTEPYRFDFFQAVRLLEKVAREEGTEEDSKSIGYDGPPSQEILRFRSLASHSFPGSEIVSLEDLRSNEEEDERESKPHFQMVVAFMGLTGPSGVLPLHYTQTVIDRVRQKDYAFRDFLDVFNQRIISLFYRAWEKYRFPIAFERAQAEESTKDTDLFTQILFSLTGLGTSGVKDRQLISDHTLLYYSGHFSHRPRSALGLQQILEDYFSFPVIVEQFTGKWLYLPEDEQTRMSGNGFSLGMNNRLGVDVIVGNRVWNQESSFRLRIGPVDYAQYQRLMPIGDQLTPLAQLTRSYIGNSLDFDVHVVLKKTEVPPCVLGDPEQPCYLGYNAWVRCNDLEEDPNDALFEDSGYPTQHIEDPSLGSSSSIIEHSVEVQ
ncbi:MAG: type VI secretion system baseplate subunit TssG [Blastopirellula sp.]|nr:MAG: type VI secretion system baseplate subunit TssG [Blastopirellula sp.]